MQFIKDLPRWGSYVRDSIVEPAIGRDLLQLSSIENPALLRQVFGIAASAPAQLISIQKLQGALQGRGHVPTISHYLSLLGEAFLVTGIQKYNSKMLRVKKSILKLIVHDNGLCCAFERPLTVKLDREKFGRYFENAIGSRFIEAGWETYYWKHKDLEVDFVVIGPENQKWAIEVKCGKTRQSELKGVFEFCKLHSEFEPCLISLEEQKIEGALSLNAEKILSQSRGY